MLKKMVFICIIMVLSGFSGIADARENNYHIGPGDVLEISVWRDESLSRQVAVPPDGVISFPLIGDLDISNLTVTDLRMKIAKKLTDYIPDATVTVILLQVNSLRAYVIGKVNRPGELPIDMETNVMQLLAKAGGLNPFAAQNRIHILRQENGRILKIPFNYREVLKGRNLRQNVNIRRGDIVVVP